MNNFIRSKRVIITCFLTVVSFFSLSVFSSSARISATASDFNLNITPDVVSRSEATSFSSLSILSPHQQPPVGAALCPNDDYNGNYLSGGLQMAGGIFGILPLAGDGLKLGVLKPLGNLADDLPASSLDELAGIGAKRLTTGNRVPNAGGVIRSFRTEKEEVFFRVFSGDSTTGSFLTKVPPKSSAFAQEALSLPPGNSATLIQRVTVPAGTRIQRSRALPAFGRRGGAEQFELLERIPDPSFGPGVPLQ